MNISKPFRLVAVTDRKLGPIILTHPQIPKPLHGVNPRTVLGDAWWELARKSAYERAEFKCECCGVPKHEAKYHQWLEAHEVYDFDYSRGRVTFKYLVALCHSCHQYIHQGRMRMLVSSYKYPQEKYEDIMRHGNALLRKAKLRPIDYDNVTCKVAWEDWRLIIGADEFPPLHKSYADWCKHYGYTPRYSLSPVFDENEDNYDSFDEAFGM